MSDLGNLRKIKIVDVTSSISDSSYILGVKQSLSAYNEKLDEVYTNLNENSAIYLEGFSGEENLTILQNNSSYGINAYTNLSQNSSLYLEGGGGGDIQTVATGGILIAGAGKENINGIYAPIRFSNGKLRYEKINHTNEEKIYWDSYDNRWFIGDDDDAYYESDEDVSTPDLVETWTVTYYGEEPIPNVSSSNYNVKIGTFLIADGEGGTTTSDVKYENEHRAHGRINGKWQNIFLSDIIGGKNREDRLYVYIQGVTDIREEYDRWESAGFYNGRRFYHPDDSDDPMNESTNIRWEENHWALRLNGDIIAKLYVDTDYPAALTFNGEFYWQYDNTYVKTRVYTDDSDFNYEDNPRLLYVEDNQIELGRKVDEMPHVERIYDSLYIKVITTDGSNSRNYKFTGIENGKIKLTDQNNPETNYIKWVISENRWELFWADELIATLNGYWSPYATYYDWTPVENSIFTGEFYVKTEPSKSTYTNNNDIIRYRKNFINGNTDFHTEPVSTPVDEFLTSTTWQASREALKLKEESSYIPEKIIVSGCGDTELNGAWVKSEVVHQYDTKTFMWEKEGNTSYMSNGKPTLRIEWNYRWPPGGYFWIFYRNNSTLFRGNSSSIFQNEHIQYSEYPDPSFYPSWTNIGGMLPNPVLTKQNQINYIEGSPIVADGLGKSFYQQPNALVMTELQYVSSINIDMFNGIKYYEITVNGNIEFNFNEKEKTGIIMFIKAQNNSQFTFNSNMHSIYWVSDDDTTLQSGRAGILKATCGETGLYLEWNKGTEI